MTILRKWIEIIDADFSLIDDTPSKSPNTPDFIEHRHDQAIFSILCKLNNVYTLSAFEYWYPKWNSRRPDWRALKYMPIHAKRDLDYGVYYNLKKIPVKIIKKIFD